MGMINDQQSTGARVADPLLTQVIKGIEAKVKPADQEAFQRIVLAGMKVMFSPSTHGMMVKTLQSGASPVQAVASGVASLLGILYRESKNKAPIGTLLMAAPIFMAHALEYMEKTSGLDVTPDLIAETTEATMQLCLQKFGISKEHLMRATQQASQASQDPRVKAQMAQGV